MWKVHADVLKMAKTEEKRQRIKWFHARGVFFEQWNGFAEGLELARHCDHEDARLLVSLFPNGAPTRGIDAKIVFLAQEDDARCLCWAGECRANTEEEEIDLFRPVGHDTELFRRSAEKGYAWGMTCWGECSGDMQWLEKAVALGELEQ